MRDFIKKFDDTELQILNSYSDANSFREIASSLKINAVATEDPMLKSTLIDLFTKINEEALNDNDNKIFLNIKTFMPFSSASLNSLDLE